jgi:hypothetical protein
VSACNHHSMTAPQTASAPLKLTTYTPTGVVVTLDASGTLLFRQPGSPGWCAVLADGAFVTCKGGSCVHACLPDGAVQQALAISMSAPVGNAISAALAAPNGSSTDSPGVLAVAEQHTPVDDATCDGSGAPSVKELVESVTCTDADIGAVVITRADQSQRIEYRTGDAIEMRPDGSRLILFADRTWLLEAEGLPAVRGSPSGVSCVIQAGVLLSWVAEGAIVALRQEGGVEIVCAGPVVSCGVRPPCCAGLAYQTCNRTGLNQFRITADCTQCMQRLQRKRKAWKLPSKICGFPETLLICVHLQLLCLDALCAASHQQSV